MNGFLQTFKTFWTYFHKVVSKYYFSRTPNPLFWVPKISYFSHDCNMTFWIVIFKAQNKGLVALAAYDFDIIIIMKMGPKCPESL